MMAAAASAGAQAVAAAAAASHNTYSPTLLSELNEAAKGSKRFTRFCHIKQYLGLAGRKGNFRTLHEQSLLGRTCYLTEDFGLHLVWQETMIFIKPLPTSCISEDCILLRSSTITPTAQISMVFDSERWFLYSYTRLIAHESDFNLAIKLNLLPKHFSEKRNGWERWKICKRTIEVNLLQRLDPLNLWGLPSPIVPEKALREGFTSGRTRYINRFKYGELRLTRLNAAVVLQTMNPNQRFFHSPTRSNILTSAWIKWFLLVIGYAVIILTAMQVVTATGGDVPGWILTAFRYSSLGFIILVLASLVLLLFGTLLYLGFQTVGWIMIL